MQSLMLHAIIFIQTFALRLPVLLALYFSYFLALISWIS